MTIYTGLFHKDAVHAVLVSLYPLLAPSDAEFDANHALLLRYTDNISVVEDYQSVHPHARLQDALGYVRDKSYLARDVD